ncbi:hypothetical protein G647_05439 [Cladophialophora carrionii CBS 160.54]|uniref:DUF7703 domain-containing protein n=1 Tax=Cladophialophora carrionii CBS 160.54 TaxID=1279043 RepID=V9DCD7_9EURO|nr:uncharacterized protein G647_05439 [Cladophialophora carrionii CBS 160.54]ETI23637.1 hypothetical protein G647_05439 [Cladophialophora carrionii CBS 160.54]
MDFHVHRLVGRSYHDHYRAAVEKNSFTGEYSADSVIVTLSVALALYNALEMVLLVVSAFKRWKGLYFWSLCVCNFGVLCYATGILLTYFDLGVLWLGKTILDVGWVCMIACQSLVLYSRLNLVLDNVLILRAVKWMIITVSAVILPIVVVLDFGSTYSGRPAFFEGYYYIEQIQLIVISVQELAISGLYLWKAISFLNIISKAQTRRIIWQLFAINVIIISMDVVIVALQFLHYQLYQESLKGFFYSVKLKLELNILSKLVDLVNGNATQRSNTLEAIDSDAISGQRGSEVQREISPMKQHTQWDPSSKGVLQHIKEENQHHTDHPSLEASSSSTKALDEEDGIARLTSQQSSRSTRTRVRESDVWYADVLRSIK